MKSLGRQMGKFGGSGVKGTTRRWIRSVAATGQVIPTRDPPSEQLDSLCTYSHQTVMFASAMRWCIACDNTPRSDAFAAPFTEMWMTLMLSTKATMDVFPRTLAKQRKPRHTARSSPTAICVSRWCGATRISPVGRHRPHPHGRTRWRRWLKAS